MPLARAAQRWGNRDRESKLRLAGDIFGREKDSVPAGRCLTDPGSTSFLFQPLLGTGSITEKHTRETWWE